MISQNARRLDKIVDDVLNAARVQTSPDHLSVQSISLHEQTLRICSEWAAQNAAAQQVSVVSLDGDVQVRFEADHLRRVMVNLLDNARRYASQNAGSILVHTTMTPQQQVNLTVWSDGPPLEPSVERHLFEPFFSSESRSSGLGLFICRELCEGHGAGIHYLRSPRPDGNDPRAGNAFVISLQTSRTMEPWQPLLH
jgi:two-component system sensor histidine kinase PilS (NtrC family)